MIIVTGASRGLGRTLGLTILGLSREIEDSRLDVSDYEAENQL